MKRKALAVQSIPEATEKRAKRCQVSEYFPFSVAWIEAPVGPANSRRHAPSRAWLVLVLFFGLPAPLWAQKQQGSWSDLRGLKVGQGVEVIESSMKRHGGEFVNVSDAGPTLQEKCAE